MELIFVILAGWGCYALWKKIEEDESELPKEPKREKPLVSSVDMPDCYGYIMDLLNESHRTKPDAWWSIRKASPEDGRIIAMIQWTEYFGDQLGEKIRRIILTVDLEPIEDGKTEIYLHWEVESPMHRGQVNQVIDSMKASIRSNLSAR